ncbi:hypothetical protein KA001_03340 [Patescibacteria group bacterium]|nr:hypothetical protein [Patescibacteria group bacterium]
MQHWQCTDPSLKYQYEAIKIVFGNHKYLLEEFFDSKKPALRHPPDVLLKRMQSGSRGEFILIKVALDIWSESGGASVNDILNHLDDDNFHNICLAFSKLRKMRLHFLDYDVSF